MKAKLIAGALSLLALQASAACPDGTQFDKSLGFCADQTSAYGPFTQSMISACKQQGGGPACTNYGSYTVMGNNVSLQRWDVKLTRFLRGTGSCPTGSVPSGSVGGMCLETLANGTENVLGPFDDSVTKLCLKNGGGPACYTNMWSAPFYRSLVGTVKTSENKLGAWLFLASSTGMSHTQIATKLQALGVKRIFVKIADGTNNCNWFGDACDATVPQIYRDHGIEAWAWSYVYPGNSDAQATALTLAAKYGYTGYVLDIEKEFDGGISAPLESLMVSFRKALDAAKSNGSANGDFLLTATTWSNPKDHGMRVDIIDKYVDAHMPQTYLESFGSSYLSAPKYWIGKTNCDYHDLGATKPIWQIGSATTSMTTGSDLNAFFTYAGPNSSVWVIPGGASSSSNWATWQNANWHIASWDQSTACSAGNYTVPNAGPTPTPVPPAATACPDGSTFNSALGFCADANQAFGPFPAQMIKNCQALRGGSACNALQLVKVGNQTLQLQKWSLAMAKATRDTGTCPSGTTPGDSRFGSKCVEGLQANGNPTNVYGPFESGLVQQCLKSGGGNACLTQRWSADLFLGLIGAGTTPPVQFPYYDQNDNQTDGWRACNITSIAMALDYFKIVDPSKTHMRTPDYLYNLYGISGSAPVLASMFNAEAAKAGSSVRDYWTNTGTITQLRSIVGTAHKPVVIHGWFTPSGHVVEVIGWDGANYIVNDPDGVWDGVYMSQNYDTSRLGKAVKYPAAAFEAAISNNGGTDLLMHVFQ